MKKGGKLNKYRKVIFFNVIILVYSMFLILAYAQFVSIFSVENYCSLKEFKGKVMRITFISNEIDQQLLFSLSVIIIMFGLVMIDFKENIHLKIITVTFSFLFGLITLIFGLNSVAQVLFTSFGLLSISVTLMSKNFRKLVGLRLALVMLIMYCLSFFMVVESASLCCWLTLPFIGLAKNISVIYPVKLEIEFFYSLAWLSPYLLIIILFSWGIVPLRRFLKSIKKIRIKIWKKTFTLNFSTRYRVKFNTKNVFSLKKGKSIALLAILACICAFCVYYPYIPSLKSEGKIIGVDTAYYIRIIEKMRKMDLTSAWMFAFSNFSDRPLSLLLMNFISGFSGSLPNDILLTTTFLALLLATFMYCFVQEAIGNNVLSLLAFIFGFTSYPLTVGMFAGFFSNWMALIGIYIFSFFLFRFIHKGSSLHAICTIIAAVSILFIHAYTWSMLIGVLLIYTMVCCYEYFRGKNKKRPKEMKILLITIVLSILADVLKNSLLGRTGVAVEAANVASNSLAFNQLPKFWSSILFVFRCCMHGFFVNSPFLLLALFGAFIVLKDGSPLSRYLKSWLLASSLPFIFGDSTIKTRILYNLPLPILAAIGLYSLVMLLYNFKESLRWEKVAFLFISFSTLLMLNYVFRCLFELTQITFPSS